MHLYPLQFYPILKERIWGGNKLQTLLHKPYSNDAIGESWEISTVAENISIVSNGYFKDTNLQDLIEQFPKEILGDKVYAQYGKQFPLLFKYLDARENLSVQVHPEDSLAKKRHNSFGKTEMWYVMQADENTKLIAGFNQKITPEAFVNAIETKSVLDCLDVQEVSEGDVFFLEAGTVHAIGAGALIAEIQQTSDITYRIYDFDRIDKDGQTRPLHIDLALEAINYEVVESKQDYWKQENTSNRVVTCPYFTTNVIPLTSSMVVTKTSDSFVVYLCTKGHFTLCYENKTYHYTVGDTILLPASISSYLMDGDAVLLEVTIS